MAQGEGATVAVVPDVGQVVVVRGANWAVVDVQPQGLPRSGADDAVTGLQHAVTLQSLEEDRLGQELRVVWELELGKSLRPEQGLPTVIDAKRFDDPSTLAAFIDALRWGSITSADSQVVQAPFRSGANIEAYQLEPLRRALRETRANLLLADDVGLGKTIEAGLVIQELFLRHRARSAIIVCPAGLTLKWQDEMIEKFGLDFTIINSETMRDVRRTFGLHANPFTLLPRIIVSMSWLPGQRAQRLLRDVFARVDAGKGPSRFAFDILVVDEAHHVAPSSPQRVDKLGMTRRGYAVDSLRTHAVREVAERAEHRLFLTATPHNGYIESFTALLEMIDPQRFVRGTALDRAALKEVAVRRLKRDLKEAKGFRDRKVMHLAYTPTQAEDEAYQRLVAFTQRRDKAVASADSGRKSARDLATLLLKKRFFSSPEAFARTVDVYLSTRLGRADVDFDAQYDDVLGIDADDLEEGLVDQTEMLTLKETKRTLPELTKQDKADLTWLSEWGHEFEGTTDGKLEALIKYFDGVMKPDGRWNNERVVVFTEYVDTLEWIRDNLLQHGYESDRIAVITGGTDAETREIIRAEFNEPPTQTPVRVLLATDAAGEGIDLQHYCHRLFNYDIPFNPNRLEQRIGRVDRYGQEHEPEIRHFAAVSDGSALAADVDLLARVAVKIAKVEIDLGSANEIIAPDIQRQLTGSALDAKPREPSAGDKAINSMLQGDRQLSAELTELEQQFDQDRDRLHLRPANLQRVVETALELDLQPPLVEVGSEDVEAPVFQLPDLARSWEPVTRGLASRLRPDELRPITFDREAASKTTDLVHAHLGHPLLQRSTRLLRSALWADDTDLHRVSAVVVPDLDESIAAAVTRLVLVGRGGIRLHEEVFLAGTRLSRRQQVGAETAEALLDSALDSDKFKEPSPALLRQIAHAWNATGTDALRSRVQAAIQQRVGRRTHEVEEQLARRQGADLARVEAVFSRFGHTLRDAMAEAEKMQQEAQQMLFDVAEQRQSERDLRQMRARLDALDEELRREHQAIRVRYEDVKAWPFPAAVIFAISEKDAEKGLTIR